MSSPNLGLSALHSHAQLQPHCKSYIYSNNSCISVLWQYSVLRSLNKAKIHECMSCWGYLRCIRRMPRSSSLDSRYYLDGHPHSLQARHRHPRLPILPLTSAVQPTSDPLMHCTKILEVIKVKKKSRTPWFEPPGPVAETITLLHALSLLFVSAVIEHWFF